MIPEMLATWEQDDNGLIEEAGKTVREYVQSYQLDATCIYG